MKKLYIPVLILILVIVCFSVEYLIRNYEVSLNKDVYSNVNNQFSTKVLAIKSVIDRNFNLMVSLEAFVTANYLKDAADAEIWNYLEFLYKGTHSSAFNLVIAPDAVVTYVYPVEGNENFVQYNYLTDSRMQIQNQLDRAFKSRQMTVDGPFQLLQGNTGLIARKAVYQADNFWGMISVGLDLDNILNSAGLVNSESSILQLAIRLPGQPAFYGDDALFNTEGHLFALINLPQGFWEVAALPKQKQLHAVEQQIMLIRTISLIALALTFGIFYNIRRQRDKLQETVELRTNELQFINDELLQKNEELKHGKKKLREQYLLLDTYTHKIKESEKKLTFLAYHDVLTGILNRAGFQHHLEELLTRKDVKDQEKIVLFFDLDNFKIVNDTFGHFTGDLLLQEVVNRIVSSHIQHQCFARFGGDEFALLLTEPTSRDQLTEIADQLLALFKEPFYLTDRLFYVSPSVGIAQYPEDGYTQEALLLNADIAMYAAKKEGGNRYKIYHGLMETNTKEKLEMGNHLRKAIEREELEIHYQPQVDCLQAKIIGIEALLRWKHSSLGYISPAVFIPLAEEMGLIVAIGEWVLKNACEQIKAFQDQYHYPIQLSVNLSVKQLQDVNLVDKVSRILTDTAFEAQYLELEITENSAMKDDHYHVLQQLRTLGVAISVDDFGTHYSSLSYLKRFPVTKIKLDQSFVRGIQTDPKDRAIINAIIYVAQSFNLAIVAEGVETVEQAAYLIQNGCSLIQGFYFYRPMKLEMIGQLLVDDFTHKLPSAESS